MWMEQGRKLGEVTVRAFPWKSFQLIFRGLKLIRLDPQLDFGAPIFSPVQCTAFNWDSDILYVMWGENDN